MKKCLITQFDLKVGRLGRSFTRSQPLEINVLFQREPQEITLTDLQNKNQRGGGILSIYWDNDPTHAHVSFEQIMKFDQFGEALKSRGFAQRGRDWGN